MLYCIEATADRNFQYWVHQLGMNDINGYENVLNEEVMNTNESIFNGKHMYQLLKGRDIVDTILHSVNDSTLRSKCFLLMDLEILGRLLCIKLFITSFLDKGIKSSAWCSYGTVSSVT